MSNKPDNLDWLNTPVELTVIKQSRNWRITVRPSTGPAYQVIGDSLRATLETVRKRIEGVKP